MKIKKSFFIFSFILLFSFFFLDTKKTAYGADHLEYYLVSDNASKIKWEIGLSYYYLGGRDAQKIKNFFFTDIASSTYCTGWNRCATDDFIVSGGAPYALHWGTACVDPKAPAARYDDDTGDTGDKYYSTGVVNITATSKNSVLTPEAEDYYPGGTPQFSGWYDDKNCPRPPRYSIDGHVFIDRNGNGDKNSGEPFWNSSGQPLDKWGDYYEDTGTNSNGYFNFYNLPPRDDYGIKLNIPNGWICTTANDCKVGCQSQNCGSGITLPKSKSYTFGIVENKPDLVISKFNFPGGYTGRPLTPTVIIANRGYKTVTESFTVRVCNGGGTNGGECITSDPITANLAQGDTRDISDAFAGIHRPTRAGSWTARAIVDYSDDISNESNENNNDATDDYTTRVIPTPDLDIVGFNYPGGPAGTQVDVTVKYINRGDAQIPVNSGIDLTVCPGNGSNLECVTRTINRQIPADQVAADAFTLTFSKMNLPSTVDSFTATAEIDSNDAIPNESNEGNNFAQDTYQTTQSINAKYSVSGGLFDDTGNKNGIKDPGEDYINSTAPFQINGSDGFTASALSTNGNGFKIPGLTSGTSFTVFSPVSNIPEGYAASYPSYVTSWQTPSINIPCTSPNPGEHLYNCASNDLDIIGVDFGIYKIPPPKWFMGIGGDMRIDKVNFENPMPNGFYFSNSNPSAPTLSYGVVFGPSINLGSGNTYWSVKKSFNPTFIKTSYVNTIANLKKSGSFNTKIDLFGGSVSGCDSTESTCTFTTLPTPEKIYTSGDLNINSSNPIIFNGGRYIFLVDGVLNIKQEIQVTSGSVVIFIVSKDISIEGNVNKIQGIFSADNDFVVKKNTGVNQTLNVEGSIIINAKREGGTLLNYRDLEDGNTTTPSIQIRYRPDFVLNAPSFIRFPNISYQEIAPGQ